MKRLNHLFSGENLWILCIALVLLLLNIVTSCTSQKDFTYIDEYHTCRAVCHKCHLIYTCGHRIAHKPYCILPDSPKMDSAFWATSPKVFIFKHTGETIYLDWTKKDGRIFRVDSLGNKLKK